MLSLLLELMHRRLLTGKERTSLLLSALLTHFRFAGFIARSSENRENGESLLSLLLELTCRLYHGDEGKAQIRAGFDAQLFQMDGHSPSISALFKTSIHDASTAQHLSGRISV